MDYLPIIRSFYELGLKEFLKITDLGHF